MMAGTVDINAKWRTVGLVTVGIVAAGVGLIYYMKRKSRDSVKKDLATSFNSFSELNFATDLSLSLEDFISSSASSASDLSSVHYPEYDIYRLLANTGIDGFPCTFRRQFPANSIHESPSFEQRIRSPVHRVSLPEEPVANHSAPNIDMLDCHASEEQAGPAFSAVRAASAASIAVVNPGKRHSPRQRSPLRNRGHVHQQENRKRFHLAKTPADDLVVPANSNNACDSSDKEDGSECRGRVTKQPDFARRNSIDSYLRRVGTREMSCSTDAVRRSVVKAPKRSKSKRSPSNRAACTVMSSLEAKMSDLMTSSSEDGEFARVRSSRHRKTSSRHRKQSDAVASSDYRESPHREKKLNHVMSSRPDSVTSSNHTQFPSLVSTPALGRPSVLRRTSATRSDRVTTLKRDTSSDPVLGTRHATSSSRTISPRRMTSSNRKKQCAREKFTTEKIGQVGLNVCSSLYREMCQSAGAPSCKERSIVSRFSDSFHRLIAYQREKQKRKKEFNFTTSLGPPDWDEVLCYQTRGMDFCRTRNQEKSSPKCK